MNTTVKFKGIGFAQLLTVAFIVLKLTNVITWSWLWVLSPLWISFALAVLFMGLALIIVIMGLGEKKINKINFKK